VSRSTGDEAREERKAKLNALQSRMVDLHDDRLLTRVKDEMSEIDSALSLFPGEIEQLRTRGYVFKSFLERKVEVLDEQWGDLRAQVSREVSRHVRDLDRETEVAESALQQALGGRQAQLTRAEGAIGSLESKISAAERATRALYETLQQNVQQTRAQLEEIGWTLDQVDEAGFRLYPAEDVVAACKAQFLEHEKDGPQGVLFLTDERVLFEQKEEIATKKVLFITTEKEKVQELIFEVPIGQVEEVRTEDKGLFGGKEMLELLFAPEADLSEARLRLRGVDNEAWAGLIGRVKSQEIAKERTQPKDEAAVEAARTAPTKCPTCGATLEVEIVRGMREITCEYCGSVIRL
jgi:hypothetical protein